MHCNACKTPSESTTSFCMSCNKPFAIVVRCGLCSDIGYASDQVPRPGTPSSCLCGGTVEFALIAGGGFTAFIAS